jgi:glycosyltransferase involved in cell wall biosynthesis
LPLFLKFLLKKRTEILNYDLINSHWGFPPGGLAFFIKKFYRIPYVLTLHGSDIHTIPYENIMMKKKTIKILNSADCNIFVSPKLKDSAETLGYKNKNYKIVPNSVNLEKFFPINIDEQEELKAQLKIKNEKIIGYVGNLTEVKGADRLPFIFQEINNILGYDFCFLIVGEGHLRGYIEERCKGLGLKTLFVGKVEPNQVNKYLNIIDIILMPSRNEGLGNVILEANAVGTIVLGTDVGGIPYAIGNNNWVIKERNNIEKEFAEKVLQVLTLQKVTFLKDDLRIRIKNNFSIAKLSDKEFTINEKIILDSRDSR